MHQTTGRSRQISGIIFLVTMIKFEILQALLLSMKMTQQAVKYRVEIMYALWGLAYINFVYRIIVSD